MWQVFYNDFINSFLDSNDLPDNHHLHDYMYDAFDASNLVEELSRTRKGDKAIQINLSNIDAFLKNVVKEFEDNDEDLYNFDLEFILDWSDSYDATQALRDGVKALKGWYEDKLKSIHKINPRKYRLASTRKVAGHIVLAGTVNVRQLRRDLEDTFGIEDIEIEDGVLTFLMSTMDNKKVEKQVKALAKKHDVKFEKGEFTDGLGMIYTKNASRRNRY